MNKRILDPCCGSRMFWFDKKNKDVVFGDIRKQKHTLCDGRTLSISPDIEMDFRNLPFDDESFYLIVFDPPHLIHGGESSWLVKKYGKLSSSWENDLKKGFDECWRVLKENGVLIFKWNETQIPVSKIIKITEKQPLFGHKSGKQQLTHWLTFIK